MKEIVGNLVVTDLRKYLESCRRCSNDDSNERVTENFDRINYNFKNVRGSIIDAYQGLLFIFLVD